MPAPPYVPSGNPAQERLVAKWQAAKQRQLGLSQRHDSSGDVEFRFQPWYPQYAIACQEISVLTAQLYALENATEYPTWIDNGPGEYPWEQWKRRAIQCGVEADLADLGSDVYGAAFLNAWSDALRDECGWSDDGQAMIALALSNPETAEDRWNHLLRNEGLRDLEAAPEASAR